MSPSRAAWRAGAQGGSQRAGVRRTVAVHGRVCDNGVGHAFQACAAVDPQAGAHEQPAWPRGKASRDHHRHGGGGAHLAGFVEVQDGDGRHLVSAYRNTTAEMVVIALTKKQRAMSTSAGVRWAASRARRSCRTAPSGLADTASNSPSSALGQSRPSGGQWCRSAPRCTGSSSVTSVWYRPFSGLAGVEEKM